MHSFSKLSLNKQTNVDRISNLPWDVLDTILVHLPLRQAARTSILSSKWRRKWTCLSQFIFDDKCIRNGSLDKEERWVEIMKIIDQIQSNHNGPIEKFKLAAYCHPNHSELNQWITLLTEKGIKELIIQEFSFIMRFKLPSCIYICPKLSCLELYGCMFELPSSFKGFDCLKSLELNDVSITSGILKNLISNCPVLERLALFNIDSVAFIRIHNPCLKSLKVYSWFEDICLESCPHLVNVNVSMIRNEGDISQHIELGKICNLVRIMGCLSAVNRLILSSQFLEFLANDNVPQRLPTMLNCLVALDLKEVRFGCLRSVRAAVSILRSSPNLKELVITVQTTNQLVNMPVVEFVKSQCLCDFYFDQLKVVKIRGALTRTLWEFIKFILAHSPLLESMTIVDYSGQRISESLLMSIERAAEHVKFTSLIL